MRSAQSGIGRCRALSFSVNARSQAPRTFAVVRMTGMAMGMDRMDLRIRVRCQQAEQVGRKLAFLDLSHRCPVCADAGKDSERPFLVEGEADRLPGTAQPQPVLQNAGDGPQATVTRLKPFAYRRMSAFCAIILSSRQSASGQARQSYFWTAWEADMMVWPFCPNLGVAGRHTGSVYANQRTKQSAASNTA